MHSALHFARTGGGSGGQNEAKAQGRGRGGPEEQRGEQVPRKMLVPCAHRQGKEGRGVQRREKVRRTERVE